MEALQEGDRIRVDGVLFRIVRVEPDGSGSVTAELELDDPPDVVDEEGRALVLENLNRGLGR